MMLLFLTAALAAATPTAKSAPAKTAAPKPAAAKPAAAATPAISSDLRCLMLSNLFAKSDIPQAKVSAGQTRLFYLGRVSAKYSAAQLPAVMTAAAKVIDPDKAGAEMNKCLTTLQTSAAQVEAAGTKAKTAAGPVIPAQMPNKPGSTEGR